MDYYFRLINIPWWYYLAASVISLGMSHVFQRHYVNGTKSLCSGMLCAYIFLIFAATVFSRTPFIGLHFQPRLFWSYRVWSIQKDQIIANVVFFIPIGMLAYPVLRWKSIGLCAGISLVVELSELFSYRGLFEFDDILHNCMGAAVGCLVCFLAASLWKKHKNV